MVRPTLTVQPYHPSWATFSRRSGSVSAQIFPPKRKLAISFKCCLLLWDSDEPYCLAIVGVVYVRRTNVIEPHLANPIFEVLPLASDWNLMQVRKRSKYRSSQ